MDSSQRVYPGLLMTAARRLGGGWSGPWARREACWLSASSGVAALACAGAWAVVSGRASIDDQIGLAGLSVLGLAVAFSGNVIWLSRGRRAVGDRARHLFGDVAIRPARRPESMPSTPATVVVGGPGLRWFHRPSCPLATGQPWLTGQRAEHEHAGQVPCRVCRP